MIVPTASTRLVLSTAGSRDEAERIAAALLEAQLVACVNLLPGVSSVYRWRGKVETAEEILLLIKTTADKLDAVEATLRAVHSYELPEFLVLQPEAVTQAYADWIAGAIQP